MSSRISENFGWFVRQRRVAQGISLRQMAKMIEVSPAYLSQVERGQSTPPTEDKVTAIAKILDLDADELLAVAGKVSSDLTKIIREQPSEMAILIRGTYGMSEDDRAKFLKRFAAATKKRKTPDTN